jgi:hypothetical protein
MTGNKEVNLRESLQHRQSEGRGLGFQQKYHIYTRQNDAVLSIKALFFKSWVGSEKVENSTHILTSDPTFSELKRNF